MKKLLRRRVFYGYTPREIPRGERPVMAMARRVPLAHDVDSRIRRISRRQKKRKQEDANSGKRTGRGDKSGCTVYRLTDASNVNAHA